MKILLILSYITLTIYLLTKNKQYEITRTHTAPLQLNRIKCF